MIRKIMAIMLSLVCVLSLSSCGGSSSNVDVDLTELSETVMFAKVSDILVTPDEYDGKTIKVTGEINVYYEEAEDKNYFAMILVDSTNCCTYVLEFDKDPSVDDKEFMHGKDQTIVGTLDFEEMGDSFFCHLIDVKLA